MSNLLVADLRKLVPGLELEDEALQIYIDAAEEQLASIPSGAITEVYRGASRVVILNYAVATIDSIREADIEVDLVGPDPDPLLAEYRLGADGRSLWRMTPGFDHPEYWSGPVTVVSTPRSFANLVKIATAQLVKGAVNNNPGILGMTEGNWTIQFANGESWESSVDDAIAVLQRGWSFA